MNNKSPQFKYQVTSTNNGQVVRVRSIIAAVIVARDQLTDAVIRTKTGKIVGKPQAADEINRLLGLMRYDSNPVITGKIEAIAKYFGLENPLTNPAHTDAA